MAQERAGHDEQAVSTEVVPVDGRDFTLQIAEITGESNKVLNQKNERIRQMEEEIFPGVARQIKRFAEQMSEAVMPADVAFSTFSRAIEPKGFLKFMSPTQETVTTGGRPLWIIARGHNLVGEATSNEQEKHRTHTIRGETSIVVTPDGDAVAVNSRVMVPADESKTTDRGPYHVVRCGSSLGLDMLFGNYAESGIDLGTIGNKVGELLVQSAQYYAAENEKTDTKLTRDYKITGSVYTGGFESEEILIDPSQWKEKAN
jgi:hypothetical protein